MFNVSIPFKQEVIHENEQIYQRIATEIKKARKQILVVTAWFTDHMLFDILHDQATNGVDVRVIIADNEDNKKLNFARLQNRGAKVYKVKSGGYGGLRTRFCVIDGQMAIHGSYNWSVNARENNQESIIVTDHADTVNSLVKQFYEMEREMGGVIVEKEKWGIRWLFKIFWKKPRRHDQEHPQNENKPPIIATTEEHPEDPDNVSDTTYTNTRLYFEKEYAGVLDRMIAAEISDFDRVQLRNEGYERAKASNGDPQVLHSALDTVYAIFINDINIVEDKKRRLTGKIQEQKIVHAGILNNKYQVQNNTIESQVDGTRQEITAKITALKAKTAIYEMDIAAIKNEKLAIAEKTGAEIEECIQEIERNSIVPKFKWYEFIPVLALSVGLLTYLFMFYSSAVYILLFSGIDAKKAEQAGLGAIYEPPQVFEPNTFSNLWHRGNGYAIGFVCFFVFLPLAVSMLSRITQTRKWIMFAAALLLDGFVAYKVTSSIHEASYLVGKVTDKWRIEMAFTDLNFYLVFILGSLGLFIFHPLFNKFISLFEERNPDQNALKLKLQKKQEKETLEKHREYITAMKASADTYRKEIVRIEGELHLAELDLINLPHKRTLLLEKSSVDLENNKKMLHDITAVYIAYIENDNPLVDVGAMKYRLGVFMEGWHGFLNEEYAVTKAAEKVSAAIEIARIWQQEKLAGNLIDNKIKLL